jgi:hypothetical protein
MVGLPPKKLRYDRLAIAFLLLGGIVAGVIYLIVK